MTFRKWLRQVLAQDITIEVADCTHIMIHGLLVHGNLIIKAPKLSSDLRISANYIGGGLRIQAGADIILTGDAGEARGGEARGGGGK
jgi:hypothetical protein